LQKDGRPAHRLSQDFVIFTPCRHARQRRRQVRVRFLKVAVRQGANVVPHFVRRLVKLARSFAIDDRFESLETSFDGANGRDAVVRNLIHP